MALVASDQTRGLDNLSPHDEPAEVRGAAVATIPRTRRQHFQTSRDDFHMAVPQEIGACHRRDPSHAQLHRQCLGEAAG